MNLHIDSMGSGTVQGAAEDQIFTSDGWCCFSQSLSAASIRVCQPLPVDLKASITSGEYRIVADFLVGRADTGLPRRMVFLPSCRLALSKKASSSSGASSGSTQVLFKSFNFAFISFPHRDNAARLTALRPDHNNKPGIQFAYGDMSDFSVVLPVIFGGKVDPCENLCGSGEINTALQQRSFPLALVVFNLHKIIVVTLNKKSNVDSLSSGRYSVLAAAKSVAGFSSLESTTAHNRASGFFTRIAHAHPNYGGLCGGIARCAGFCSDRSANPAQLTTRCLAAACGDFQNFTTEAAIMATIPTLTQPEITLISGRAVTTSLAVAAYFSKRHADVIRKIETIECTPEFTERNFALSNRTDSTGRQLPCYEITRSGFMFLVMGFTGRKAALLKENYINAFDVMEAQLSAPVLLGDYQILLTFENNVMVDSRPVRSDEFTCCMATFFEMAERQGYLVIHADDLKSLTFGNRKRGDS